MKKGAIIPTFILISIFCSGIDTFAQSTEENRGDDFEKIMTESFKKAILEADEQKALEKEKQEREADTALDFFIADWINQQISRRKPNINRLIEQNWDNLLGEPKHSNYYLRDFDYTLESRSLNESNSKIYPYTATVEILEVLFVDRAPLIATPRAEYQFSATTLIKLNLQYQASSGSWDILNLEKVDFKLERGWPQKIRSKVGTYFLPTE